MMASPLSLSAAHDPARLGIWATRRLQSSRGVATRLSMRAIFPAASEAKASAASGSNWQCIGERRLEVLAAKSLKTGVAAAIA